MKLLHLYYDLMNLYGEYGNISAISRCLARHGMENETEHRTVGEDFDPAAYDFIYIGSGTERKAEMARKDFLPRKKRLAAALAGGTVILATGNAQTLFAHALSGGKIKEAVRGGLFPFLAEVRGDADRILADAVCQTDFLAKPLVGFVNTQTVYTDIPHPFGQMTYIHSDRPAGADGVHEGNFFGTGLTGPVLVKNPHFTEYMVSLLAEKEGLPYSPLPHPAEEKAWEITLCRLQEKQ